MLPDFKVFRVRLEDKVLFATWDSPPLNLVGPDMVHDLVSLIEYLQGHHEDVSVVVFDSASPDFFSAHVDMLQVPAVRQEAGRLREGATFGALYHRLSTLEQVTIASIRGRVRGAGSEFILACDMRFASERAVFGQPEVGVGAIPGAGGAQHLTRLMGRGRAMEVLLSSQDFSADLAESYGWVNRALPDEQLDPFVDALARRIARFPLIGLADTKRRVNEIALPPESALNEDGRLFAKGVAQPEFQSRIATLFGQGLQTDCHIEAELGEAIAHLPHK
jgi:enoyl-CoA hydratase/carnithine racemase